MDKAEEQRNGRQGQGQGKLILRAQVSTLRWAAIAESCVKKVTRAKLHSKRIPLAAGLRRDHDGAKVSREAHRKNQARNYQAFSATSQRLLGGFSQPRGSEHGSLPGDHIFIQLCFSSSAASPAAPCHGADLEATRAKTHIPQ